MKMRQNRLMRRVFIMAGIVFSLLSVAILHAYAGDETETVAASKAGSAYQGSSEASVAIQPVSYKQQAKAVHTIDVCPGDTLWDIALANMPEGENVRSYIYKIKKVNGLKNSEIKSGQILILP